MKTRVEPFVRHWLSQKYSQPFSRQFLQLAGCCGVHEFDAVSADGRIVCGIKSSSALTSGGKNPSGKIAAAYEELYFLAGVEADHRILVLTDEAFHNLLSRKMREKLSRDIQLLYCPLTAELTEIVRGIHLAASNEINRGIRSIDSKL